MASEITSIIKKLKLTLLGLLQSEFTQLDLAEKLVETIKLADEYKQDYEFKNQKWLSLKDEKINGND